MEPGFKAQVGLTQNPRQWNLGVLFYFKVFFCCCLFPSLEDLEACQCCGFLTFQFADPACPQALGFGALYLAWVWLLPCWVLIMLTAVLRALSIFRFQLFLLMKLLGHRNYLSSPCVSTKKKKQKQKELPPSSLKPMHRALPLRLGLFSWKILLDVLLWYS